MTAIASDDHTPIGGVLVVILLIAVVLAGASFLIFTEHSQTSHASQVPMIDQCFNGAGAISPWFKNDEDGRWGRYCTMQTDDGKVRRFWRIYECAGGIRVVITQFMQKITNNSLTNYIANRGLSQADGSPACR